MFHLKSQFIAKIAVALIVTALLFFGLQLLTIPKIFMLTHRPDSILPYEGPVLVTLAALLAWFREWAANKLVWLCLETHRLASSLIAAAVVGAEGFMHAFNIPQIEGWWIPLVSGGAAATFGVWFKKSKKVPPAPQEAKHG